MSRTSASAPMQYANRLQTFVWNKEWISAPKQLKSEFLQACVHDQHTNEYCRLGPQEKTLIWPMICERGSTEEQSKPSGEKNSKQKQKLGPLITVVKQINENIKIYEYNVTYVI